MEVTQEHKTQIKEIISGIECPKDCECYKSEFESLCKIRILGEVVECLDDNSQLCRFSFNFGFGYFCNCPLRKYIAKNFSK